MLRRRIVAYSAIGILTIVISPAVCLSRTSAYTDNLERRSSRMLRREAISIRQSRMNILCIVGVAMGLTKCYRKIRTQNIVHMHRRWTRKELPRADIPW
ncbi:uncharacterized protein BT62DRAFT_1005290 [Guyanagaster necrorhizus]|uniref:Uncharacterized protein n=1 Tax=Guyanagaster necrorhizus TaxID=856835 RepID=A0A9P7VUW2_9AGAR|nr:uncharacterized protein BT62DRAFT_1005290 [Guyanagaster necrorhizus MCA 3950]KAG7446895.1 hypothetical protein BT62DRAFT_1005290 [Guyanagaster necrorhizus MCA 3950]